VCRELTKRFEEIVRGPIAEVAERFREAPKGEVTLVLGPEPVRPDAAAAEDAARAVGELVASGTPRKVAAEVVSRLTDVSRNELYRSSL
jgi:16S rRNA (cytidine1402-2'-O)-methyltransferase